MDDDGVFSSNDDCIVTVTQEPPTIAVMADTTADLNDTIIIRAIADDNQTIVSYLWARNGTDYLDTTVSGILYWVSSTAGTKNIRVKAIDNDGLVSNTDVCVVTVTSEPPEVSIMEDTAAYAYDSITIRATATDNGTISHYVWARDGLNFVDSTDGGTLRWASAALGEKIVIVKVIDDDGLISSSDTCIITILSLSPTITLMQGLSTYVGDSITIRAAATDNGTVEKYVWARNGVDFIDTTLVDSLRWASPNEGTFNVRVFAVDNDGLASVAASCAVTVIERPPLFDCVAYYPFNGNANDASGRGHDGTVYGSSLRPDRFAISNSAYSFDGVNDFINVGNPSDLQMQSSFTISAWIKSSSATNQGIVGKGDKDLGGYIFETHETDNSRFGFMQSRVWGSTNVLDGHWHHLVGVHDDSKDSVWLYVDNVLDFGISTAQSPNAVDSNLTIGRSIGLGGAESVNYFNGLIDDVAIFNYAISISAIDSLYHEGNWPTPYPSTLVAYYPFAGNANDASANGHDGTVYGAVLVPDRFSNPNSAYSFNGSGAYIEVPHHTALELTNTFSIAGWFNHNSLTVGGTPDDWMFSEVIVTKGLDANNGCYYFFYNAPNSTYSMAMKFPEGGAVSEISIASLPLNQWTHFAMTYYNGKQVLYINGAAVDSTEGTRTIVSNTGNLMFGNMPTTSYNFDGEIDDVSIFNKVLSRNEIDSLFSFGGWTGY